MENFVGFTTVDIRGSPVGINNVAVYQSDESCDHTMTQPNTPWGTAFTPYTIKNGTDCFQRSPAGSLANSIQASYYSVLKGTIVNTDGTPANLKFNGMPLLIHVGAS